MGQDDSAVTAHELVLVGAADDVPRARRFATAALAGSPAEPLSGDVELVVSELVTNALLHAGAPASLRVFLPVQQCRGANGQPVTVRVEVRDPLRSAPIRTIASAEAMTGRGIRLIEALVSSWGVEEDGAGKVVWSELSTAAAPRPDLEDGDFDLDALLAAWDEPDDDQQVTVRLGDVPTDLLLAAKAHVDNLVREFTLAAAGAESGNSAAVPAHLAELVETVVHRFSTPRLAIKRQAVQAAAAGLARTDLVLTLSPANVEAGEAYLVALDQADAYARAARLLTLETPPQHRIFRRWYVESLIGQVGAAARGEPVAGVSFEQRLLAEVSALAVAQRASERAARLQEVTAALGAATTPSHVAAVVVTEGVAALGASGGSVLLPEPGRGLSVPAAFGYHDRLIDLLREQLTATTGLGPRWLDEPIWIENRQDRDAVYPALAAVEPLTEALCTVPLVLADRTLGALLFSFATARLFDDDERRFVLSLAAQTAQALDRSALLAAEQAARASAERRADLLARLQRVTSDLGTVSGVDQLADVIVQNTAGALDADLATLSLLTGGSTLQLIRHIGDLRVDPSTYHAFPVTKGTPAGDTVLSRAIVVVRGEGELGRRYPEAASRLGPSSSLACVPMRFGGKVLGVLGLSFAADQPALEEPSFVAFLEAVGDASAQAIVLDAALRDRPRHDD